MLRYAHTFSSRSDMRITCTLRLHYIMAGLEVQLGDKACTMMLLFSSLIIILSVVLFFSLRCCLGVFVARTMSVGFFFICFPLIIFFVVHFSCVCWIVVVNDENSLSAIMPTDIHKYNVNILEPNQSIDIASIGAHCMHFHYRLVYNRILSCGRLKCGI